MFQSLADWFFRNLKIISVVAPVAVVLIPIIIAVVRSGLEALRSVETFDSFSWAGDYNTYYAGKLPEIPSQRDRSRQDRQGSGLASPWRSIPWRALAKGLSSYVSLHRRKVLIGLLVIALVIGAVEVAFSWGDNEMKARTTALALPPPLCSKPENTHLLIFIHGWNGDPEGTWKKFPELACVDPSLSGVDVMAVNYPTFVKRRNLNIIGLAKWVNEEINKNDEGQKYKKIAIVAHSMGGLIGREITIHRKLGDQQSIGLLVEIGTPHAGADNAKMASALGISEQLTEQMMRDSTVLNTLTSQWFSFKKNRPQTFCFTSPQDNVVSEQSALAFCDDGMEYPMWSHTEMVKPLDASDSRYGSPMRLIHQFMQP